MDARTEWLHSHRRDLDDAWREAMTEELDRQDIDADERDDDLGCVHEFRGVDVEEIQECFVCGATRWAG